MKTLKISSLIFLFLIFAMTAAAAGKDTLIFQFGLNGFKNTMDTHITEYPGNNGNNMGGNIENECCEYDPANVDGKSFLIWFDTSTIKKGSSISGATLELYMTSTRNGGNKKSVGAYRLLKFWSEGAGAGIDGVAAKADEVCGKWTGFEGGVWDVIGADGPDKDFTTPADDIIEISGDTGKYYSWNVTKMVQYWVNNPTKNYGTILLEPRPHTKTTGTKVFASKENTNVDFRPKLTVDVSAYSVGIGGTMATTWGAVK